MKIAVIGALGKAGSLICAEAAARGHAVTAIVKPESAERVAGYSLLAKSLFDLTADDLQGFDAVVNAFGTKPGSESEHISAAKHLCALLEGLPQVKLLVIGGAGSLFTDESRTRRIVEDIPESYNALPMSSRLSLDIYKQSGCNWSFISPALHFDPKGKRSGAYTLGGDVKLLNRVGESYISYADFALAMVDELEQNAHPRGHFTAVSCDPYFRGAPQYLPISRYMFSRRGCWMSLKADRTEYGKAIVHLSTNRGNRCHSGDRNYSRLYRIRPTFGGKTVPFAVQFTPIEFLLHTRHGDVRFTWADETKLLAEGDPGMGLQFSREGEPYELIKKRKNGAWESLPRQANPLLFKGLDGSGFSFNQDWNFESFHFEDIQGRTSLNDKGTFTLVVEECPYTAVVRDSYPGYAEAKASMQADWNSFLEKMPHFVQPYEQAREKVAYVLWMHLVAPSALTPNWMMLMFPSVMASQWQQVQNAVALQDDPELALSLLTAPLLHQSAEGQLADSYDDAGVATGGFKPPIYGWALQNIMQHHDIAKEWPKDKLELLYQGAGRWANWFMTCRDDDGDGLPAFEGGVECGLDESTLWIHDVKISSPDVSAYLVLDFEAQGDLAKILGKPQEEIDGWYAKSRELLNRMIETLWDGEHFVGLREEDHAPLFSTSLVHYIPFILGHRLPQEIIDKMAADLSEENALLTDYGLATERIDSDYFQMQGTEMGRGAINPPAELFICTGIWDAGKKELAKKIVGRYLGCLMSADFPHFIDPVSGDGSPFWGTWCRCAFTILARMVSEE